MTSTWPEKRARIVSLLGFWYQLLLTAFLALLAAWNGSEATQAAALLAGSGTLIWICLWLVCKQKQLVREEALEADQLRQERESSGAGAALFVGDEQLQLARRRLRWMYRWLLPIFAVLTIIKLCLWGGMYSWSWKTSVYDKVWPVPSNETLSFAFVIGGAFFSFLFSRYATGMARQAEWRMLRAGAAYLMGNALVSVAVAVTLGLVHFQMLVPERVLAYAIRIMMFVLAVEFLLNLVLDFYRPRRPDEEPRPAFESRLLGLFCEPGGIAHSIAEALNYQFGFEVSSTWFYKLMQRAITPVICFAVITMFAMSCLVIVNPGEVAIIERFGRPLQTGGAVAGDVGEDGLPRVDALGPGLHVKYPWPVSKVYRYPAQQVQYAMIGIREETGQEDLKKALVWTVKHPTVPELTVLVATAGTSQGPASRPAGADAGAPVEPPAAGLSSERSVAVSLLRVAMPIQYRIRDVQAWRTRYAEPEKMFESLAYRELVLYSAGVDVDQVIGADRERMANDLRRLIQTKADALGMGVQIVTLGLQGVHPPSEVAKEFEQVVGAESKKQAAIRTGEAERNKILSKVCGDVARANELAALIASLNEKGADPAAAEQVRAQIDDMLLTQVRGEAAKLVAEARAEMWAMINSARADADTLAQELPVYRAAPRIYKVRKYLTALSEGLVKVRKYLMATDVEPVYQLLLTDPSIGAMDAALQGASGAK